MIDNKMNSNNTWKGFKDCIVFNKVKEDEQLHLYISLENIH
jgi:nitric oxide dioxygenase